MKRRSSKFFVAIALAVVTVYATSPAVNSKVPTPDDGAPFPTSGLAYPISADEYAAMPSAEYVEPF